MFPTLNAIRFASVDAQLETKVQPFENIPVGSFFTFASEIVENVPQFGIYYKNGYNSYSAINSTKTIHLRTEHLSTETHQLLFPESYGKFTGSEYSIESEGLIYDCDFGW